MGKEEKQMRSEELKSAANRGPEEGANEQDIANEGPALDVDHGVAQYREHQDIAKAPEAGVSLAGIVAVPSHEVEDGMKVHFDTATGVNGLVAPDGSRIADGDIVSQEKFAEIKDQEDMNGNKIVLEQSDMAPAEEE